MLCPYCFDTFEEKDRAPSLTGGEPCVPAHCSKAGCFLECPECADWLEAISTGGIYAEKLQEAKAAPVKNKWEWILSPDDMTLGELKGIERNRTAEKKKYKDRWDLSKENRENWDRNSASAARGELSMARRLKLPWKGELAETEKGEKIQPDLSNFYEVRTVRKANGMLKVSKYDKHHLPFILVFDQAPRFTALGWMYGKEVAKPENLKAPNPNQPEAYFEVQEDLHPMDKLPPIPDKIPSKPPASVRATEAPKPAPAQGDIPW